MRILLVSPFLPYAGAKAGAPRAIFDRLELLSKQHDVSLVTFATPDDILHRSELERLNIRVYPVSREDNAGAARGLRLWRKRARLAAGLFTDSRPMLAQEFGSKRLRRLLERLVREQEFDVVMVEHILMAQYTRCLELGAGLPIVLTEHDVRAAFAEKSHYRDRHATPVRLLLGLLEQAKWAAYARKGYGQATCVLVPTSEDARLLGSNAQGVQAQVVPFGLSSKRSVEDSSAQLAGSERTREADTLLFVGNFDHPPNRDAAQWLCSEIMPRVWSERASVKVWLVGRNPTPDVEALGSGRIRVWGEVSSVVEYLQQCALFVAPLRQGSGMRIKLLEALLAGAPVLTTTLGAQGLDAENGRHLLVADGAENFAGAILRALDDPALRDRLSIAGALLVSGAELRSERAEKLNEALERAVARSRKKLISRSSQAGVEH